MTRIFLRIIFIVAFIIFLCYLLLPNPDFPRSLPDSIQSREPADTETPLRRGYYLNETRDEVLEFYQNEFSNSTFLNLSLPTYRLNYPPEEAQTLIRDQTQSTFLEEIVHPLRESIYVNGFEPKDPQFDVWYKGVDVRQKIIIKMVPSSPFVRLFLAFGILGFTVLLYKGWLEVLRDFKGKTI